jgi:hypothetical protein
MKGERVVMIKLRLKTRRALGILKEELEVKSFDDALHYLMDYHKQCGGIIKR